MSRPLLAVQQGDIARSMMENVPKRQDSLIHVPYLGTTGDVNERPGGEASAIRISGVRDMVQMGKVGLCKPVTVRCNLSNASQSVHTTVEESATTNQTDSSGGAVLPCGR